MRELVSEEFPNESPKLIKTSKRGDEMVYCKVATDMSEKPQKSRLQDCR